MPAAMVTPAPIAYINVVAVKKLVVGSRAMAGGVRSLLRQPARVSGLALPARW